MTVTTHILKIWPPRFTEIAEGRQPFDVRFNDRAYRVGDRVKLHEYEPSRYERGCGRTLKENGGTFTGREIERRITSVFFPEPGTDPDCGMVSGFVVLGFGIDPDLNLVRPTPDLQTRRLLAEES